MKKNGIYFKETKQTEASPEEASKNRRRRFVLVVIYILITLGAAVVYLFVAARGTQYLTAFLLALFIMVTCVEVYLSNPEKKSFSLLKKMFNKQ